MLPLVSPQEDRTAMIGERTRVALEREKMLTLRAIKELEFDRAMKKLSDEDFREMGRPSTRPRHTPHPTARCGRQLSRSRSKVIWRSGWVNARPIRSAPSPAREAAAATDGTRATALKTCAACSTLE